MTDETWRGPPDLSEIIRSVGGHRMPKHVNTVSREQFMEDTRACVTGALSSLAIAYSDAVDAVAATGVGSGEAHDIVGERLEQVLFRLLTEGLV